MIGRSEKMDARGAVLSRRVLFCMFGVAALLGACFIPRPVYAQEADPVSQLLKDGLAISNASFTVVDSQIPDPGLASCPSHINTVPITVGYSGASDPGGSGLKSITLWVKPGGGEVWTNTGLSAAGESGSFEFSDVLGEQEYYFALQAEDNAGNISPVPTGDGLVGTVYDVTPPAITLLGAPVVEVTQGTTYTDAGVTAYDTRDGDVTGSVVTVNPVDTSTPGMYVVLYDVTDASGNQAAQVARTVNVLAAYSLVVLQPAYGSVSVAPAPVYDDKYVAGTVVTLVYAPSPGSGYELASWTGAQQDAQNALQAFVTMDADKTVSVNLVREKGTVVIEVTPDAASWTVTDPDGGTHSGSGDTTLGDIPTGTVAVVYQGLLGYETPDPETAVLAKDATVTFSVEYTQAVYVVSASKTLTAEVGEAFDCPITLNDGHDVRDYLLDVTFDGTIMECVGVSSGSLTGGWGDPAATVTENGVVVTHAGADLPDGSGSLVVLRLRIKDSAQAGDTSPVHFAAVSLSNGVLEVNTSDGLVTATAATFVWGDVNEDGSSTAVDAGMILRYKVGQLGALPVTTASGDPDYLGGADVSGNDPSLVGTFDAALILQQEAGLLSTFPADTNGDGRGPELLGAKDLADALAKALAEELAKSGPRTVSMVTTISMEPGIEVNVPVSIDDATSVLGYFVDVAYDINSLEFLSAANGGLTEAWAEPTLYMEPGRIRLAAAGAQAPIGSGALAMLTFRTLGSPGIVQNASLNLAEAELNDGAIALRVQSAGAAPIIDSITPTSGVVKGGTVVTIEGANLSDVYEVLFGNSPAAWFKAAPRASSLSVISPPGAGTVDVHVATPGGLATLPAGFTYVMPAVDLEITPEGTAYAGQILDVPVWLSTPSGRAVSGVAFKLNFDRKMFSGRHEGEVVMLGDGAVSAGKNVRATFKKPGELRVTIEDGSLAGSEIPEGLLCTCRLLSISNTSDVVGLIYVSDVSATGPDGKTF